MGGKTVGLMLRMHEPIARQGKACTMASGLCVSKGIVEMHEKLGVYGQALIKKRGANWPKGVPGDKIDHHFVDKPLGYCKTLWVEIEGKQMFIHCMKEEKYVTKFMSTFGTLDEVPTHKTKCTTAGGSSVTLSQCHCTTEQSIGWMIIIRGGMHPLILRILGRHSGGRIVSLLSSWGYRR